VERTTGRKFRGVKWEGHEKNEALRMLKLVCHTRVFNGDRHVQT